MDDQEPQAAMPGGAAGTPALDAKGAARRRFARIGAGATTGVILTLHSQPGMAASTLSCASPSGFMSTTTNSRSPQNSCSSNRSHGYWKTHEDAWKSSAGVDSKARFGRIFPCPGIYERLSGVTLMMVVDPSGPISSVDHNNVAMHTVAAYLNARAAQYAGLPSVLPEDLVMRIWTDYATKGYYSPDAGTTFWSGAQISFYLQSTFR
jgi:hypothetical protein